MTLLIVGSGLGGYLLLKELREQSYTGEIKLFTADDGAFYSKPQISNALAQNKSANDLINIDAKTMQSKYSFKLYSNTIVESIQPDLKTITAGGVQFKYDKCVLALGANPISSAWDECAYKINNLSDYRNFREFLTLGKKIAIVGAGLVGCELAADLVLAGYEVHLYSNEPEPINRLMPAECGKYLRTKLIQAGVNWHYVKDFSVTKVQNKLLINREIEVDLLISALGIRPNTELATAIGIEANNGIVVDGFCQTSVKDIYALGDCANVNGQNLAYVAPIRQCINVLVKSLMAEATPEIIYPIMPVIIKTPMCRIILVSSAKGVVWEITEHEQGLVAKHLDDDGVLRGFVLMGQAAKYRSEFMQNCVI